MCVSHSLSISFHLRMIENKSETKLDPGVKVIPLLWFGWRRGVAWTTFKCTASGKMGRWVGGRGSNMILKSKCNVIGLQTVWRAKTLLADSKRLQREMRQVAILPTQAPQGCRPGLLIGTSSRAVFCWQQVWIQREFITQCRNIFVPDTRYANTKNEKLAKCVLWGNNCESAHRIPSWENDSMLVGIRR